MDQEKWEREVDDFELPDVRGGTFRLGEALKRGPVLLVFYRGGWCPICNSQLGELSQHYDEVEQLGVQIAAISNEEVRQGEKVLKKVGPPYPLLLDGKSEVIEAVGLEVVRRDPLGFVLRKEGYAHPGMILVGEGGEVLWSYRGKNYRDRPSMETVLEALRESAGK